LFNEQMRAALFQQPPLRHPDHRLAPRDGATRPRGADRFLRRHYWPNNAVLVVAGDVTPERCAPWPKPITARSPPIPTSRRSRPQEPPQIADRRVVYEDERVANPYVARAYPVPAREPGDQRRAAALTMLAEILGGSGQTGLGRQLQVEEERALYAAAFYDSTSYDPSSFNLVNVPVRA
jgi:zinc protease